MGAAWTGAMGAIGAAWGARGRVAALAGAAVGLAFPRAVFAGFAIAAESARPGFEALAVFLALGALARFLARGVEGVTRETAMLTTF
jgi:hypothetical protein